jgi:lysozyme family protein
MPVWLDDLFNQVIRPNKVAVKKEVYRGQMQKMEGQVASLTIIPWYVISNEDGFRREAILFDLIEAIREGKPSTKVWLTVILRIRW